VVPNSAAEKAGLKVGDVITKINDTEVKTASAAADAIHALKVGDKVSIEITRDGKSQTISATLEAGSPETMPQIQVPFGNGNGGNGGDNHGNNPFERGFGIIYNGSDKTWQIRGLSQDSDLYKAGLREGDVIKTFDGKAYDPSELATYLQGLDSSATVTLSVERDNAAQDITVSASALSSMTMFSFGTGGNFDFPFGGGLPFGFNEAGSGARLGVQFVTLDAQKAKDHNVTVTDGALVTDVITGTPAETAGLKVNDIITAVDGDKVDQEHTLRDRLVAYEPGDTIKLDVLRDGNTQQISVTLDQGSLQDAFPSFFDPNGFQFFGPDGQPFDQQPTPVPAPNL
jgi:S1-C subfamily serine protease